MTSIDPTSRLLAHLASATQELRRKYASGADKGAGSTGGPSAGRVDAMQVAVREVARLDRDDPDARGKAFRAYLSAVLVQELGPQVAQDPGFSNLVDRVRDTMRADPGLQDAIEQAGELLLKTAHGS